MPFLRIVDGYGEGLVYELTRRIVTVGRDPSNDIQLGDPKASRFHLELIRDQRGAYELKELGSSNGTWMEESRINHMPLQEGMAFRIGRTLLRYDHGRPDPRATFAETAEAASIDDDTIEGLDGEHRELFRSGSTAPSQANDYLVLLHDLVLRSNRSHNRDQLFELLDDAAAELLEGDRCAVFLPTEEGWELWPTFERRLRARFGAVPFAQTLLDNVRRRGEPLLCTLRGDIDPSRSMVQSGVSSAMAAPLRIGDEIHACLYVDRLERDEPFQRTDLEFLAAAADHLAVRLHNQTHVRQLAAEVQRLRSTPQRTAREIIFIGDDPALDEVKHFIQQAAPTDAPILITGESGTGKELVARSVHQQSKRADAPMQVVNCAALAESLVESTLFGHARGAFTGADDSKPGVFELADKGTLFLDELGELPLGVQAKLLRALEQGEVQRLGDQSIRQVDVRIIAATNRRLDEEVQEGRFREDLFHRLDVLSVRLPPLRERGADIDLLIDHFLEAAAERFDRPAKHLSPEARALLVSHPWPGNVRQLRNVIERACVLTADATIQAHDLPGLDTEGDQDKPLPSDQRLHTPLVSLADVERSHILRVLEHLGGNKKAAAELLGIDRSTLYAKLRQYGEI